jgi:cysteinyl-tRNA synthetase
MALPQILLTNTLTGKKEPLKTLKEGSVNMYMCGPTVYGFTHIGNARAALTGDLVARTLEYAGYKVRYARNITDIDDKIINKANEENREASEVAKEFEAAYDSELSQMNVRRPDFIPHATEHVSDMHKIIRGLMDKDLAYAADTPFGADVYFRVEKFKPYGKLSKRNPDDMQAGARIEVGEAKQNPLDFALWKAAKPGEPSWDFDGVGAGRPGWHIECSAMIAAVFPEGLDLHLGGIDLIFPHHENEIAQSEALTGKELASQWVHNGMLTIQREKMSKSLGNFFRTNDFLEQYGAETLKLIYLQHHYRSPIDFSEEAILRAEGLIERLYRAKVKALEHAHVPFGSFEMPAQFKNLEKIDECLFDDFNSAKAIGHVLGALRVCHKDDKPELWAAWGHACLKVFSRVFGLLEQDPQKAIDALRARRLKRMKVTDALAKRVDDELLAREELRKNKKFDEADAVRKKLEAEGFQIMDGPDGACWSVSEGGLKL